GILNSVTFVVIQSGDPYGQGVFAQRLIVIKRGAAGAIGAKLLVHRRPGALEVRLDQAAVDDARWCTEAVEHGIGPAADFRALENVAVHRQVAEKKVTREIGRPEPAHARGGSRAVVAAVRIDEAPAAVDRVGKIAADA